MNSPTAINAKTHVRNLRGAWEVLGRNWKHLASRRYHSFLFEPSMDSVLGSSPRALRDVSYAVRGETTPKRCSYLAQIKRNPGWSHALRSWTWTLDQHEWGHDDLEARKTSWGNSPTRVSPSPVIYNQNGGGIQCPVLRVQSYWCRWAINSPTAVNAKLVLRI